MLDYKLYIKDFLSLCSFAVISGLDCTGACGVYNSANNES